MFFISFEISLEFSSENYTLQPDYDTSNVMKKIRKYQSVEEPSQPGLHFFKYQDPHNELFGKYKSANIHFRNLIERFHPPSHG